MGHESPFTSVIANMYIEQFSEIYLSVRDNAEKIKNELNLEEGKFAKTLKEGNREFEKILNGFKIAFERTGHSVTQIS
jgi:alanyl-tRNA synthetase